MENKVDLIQPSLRNGLITGLISSMATYGLYLISVESLFGYASLGISVIIIAIIVYFSLQIRQLNGGFFTFKEAFTTSLITGVVSTFIGGIFTYVLYNVLDPDLADMAKEYTIETTEKMLESFGAGGEAVDQAMADIENQDFNQTIGKVMLQILYGSIFWAVVSLIIGAAIKKKQPEDFLQ